MLYEMLTGRTAFAGDTLSDTIAAILSREPEWKTLPGSTPERVRDLLRRCLHKDPKRRLHDIADARIEIDEALTAPPAETAPAASSTIVRPPSPWRRIAAFAMAALVAGIAVWLATRPVLPPPRVLRLTITPPSAAAITISGTDRDLAITPEVATSSTARRARCARSPSISRIGRWSVRPCRSCLRWSALYWAR